MKSNRSTTNILDNIYSANMNLISQIYPTLYSELEKVGNVKSKIFINNRGEADIRHKGSSIYNNTKNIYSYIAKQYNDFITNPIGIVLRPVGVEDKEGIHFDYLKNIFNISPIMDGKTIKHYSYKYDKNHIPMLIVFGIGNGMHLEWLIQSYDIRHVILVEHDLEMLKASMYITNWGKIFRHVQKKHRSISLVWDDTAEGAVSQILTSSRKNNPIFVANALIYEHYTTDFFKKILYVLSEKAELILRGWGFFDDEYATIKQTIQNIHQRVPLYTGKPDFALDENASAFLIANGPSLDNSIETIKKHQDKAIIFSCGTAIGSLYRSGITPDFHIEMERPYKKYQALISDVPQHYLKKIRIIAPTRVHPNIFKVTDFPFMYIKTPDAGGSLFSNIFPKIPFDNPTVSNAALTLALHLGYKKIFLFGMDMGIKSEDHHHSQKSLYYKKNRAFNHTKKYTKKTAGTYEDLIKTNSTLYWSKTNIEILLQSFPDAICYNCSDGASIESTEPLPQENIKQYFSNYLKKEEYIQKMCFMFTNKYENEVLDIQDRTKSTIFHINEFLQSFESIIHDITSRFEVIDMFYNLNNLSECYKQYNETVYHLFKGSILYYQQMIYTHAFSCPSEDQAIQFINDSLIYFKKFLTHAALLSIESLEHMENKK